MSSAELSAPALRASRRRYGEDVIKGLLALCAFVSVATTVGIVVALLLPALEFFREISVVDFLTGKEWSPLFEPAHFGVLPLVSGTFVVMIVAGLVAIPLGLGSAIYLSEYARRAPEASSSRRSKCSRGSPRSSSASSRSPS